MFEQEGFQINLNAFTLVVHSMNGLYKNIIKDMKGLIDGEIVTRKSNLKTVYILCARLYLIDRFLWGAIFADHNEIFY